MASIETSTGSPVRRGMQIGLGVTGIVSGAILLWYTAQVLLVFFAAIFLAVFFSGVGRYLQKHTRFSYPFCVAFTLIGLLQLMVIAGLLVGPAIADQSTNLSDALPKAYHQLLNQIKGSPWGSHALAGLQRAMDASKDSNWQSTLKFAGLQGMIRFIKSANVGIVAREYLLISV